MDGPRPGSLTSVRLVRQAESSRLQLELVRRAFELLVPKSQHRVVTTDGTRRHKRSAAARASVPGG